MTGKRVLEMARFRVRSNPRMGQAITFKNIIVANKSRTSTAITTKTM